MAKVISLKDIQDITIDKLYKQISDLIGHIENISTHPFKETSIDGIKTDVLIIYFYKKGGLSTDDLKRLEAKGFKFRYLNPTIYKSKAYNMISMEIV